MIKSANTETNLNSIISNSSIVKDLSSQISPNHRQRQRQHNHHQKSSVTVSKSSSEGVSTLDGIETSATSIDDSKNSSPINRLNLTINSKMNNSIPTQSYSTSISQKRYNDNNNNSTNDALTTSITTTDNIDTETMTYSNNPNGSLNLISNDSNNSIHNLLQPSRKILPGDNDNFKVTIPQDNSMIQITEDLSSIRTSSSEEDSLLNQTNTSIHNNGNNINNNNDHYNNHIDNLDKLNNIHPVHSYRVLAEPIGNSTIIDSLNFNKSKRSSGIDPLTSIENEQTPLINIPNSEPVNSDRKINYINKNSVNHKSNTFPRLSNENPFKHRNNRTQVSNIPIGSSSTKNTSDRRTYQSINTIKIPDNYQRTELASSTSSDHHAMTTGDYPKRNRVAKTSSFMNASRRKSKMKADDLYNIPGQNISENHENYAIVYDLVTGIRFSVSRCSKHPVSITNESFKQVTKLIFNRQGNAQAPPTKYEFKFKDYAPEVFRDLRRMFNVNQADYLMSLNDEIGVRAVGSSGKSGSSFYYSNDRKFIIKTIHRSEHKHLRRILNDYYNYVKNNPNTLLCQFYGLHRLKMATRTGTVKVHVLVMNNLLPPLVNVTDCYDLKGSTFGRKTSEKKRLQGSCMKDLNFIENKTEIYLSNKKKEEVENQLKNDIALLKRLNIMDYSLLLGLKYLNNSNGNLLDEKSKRASLMVHQDVPGAHKNSIFDTDGGIRAVDTNGEEMDIVYYIGIIDCLTNYNTLKKLETFFRSLRHKRETISAVPPYEYGDRFLTFIFNHIKSPGDEVVSKKKDQSKFKAFKKFANHSHTA